MTQSFLQSNTARVSCGDALAELRNLPDGYANCCVTSPPYFGLRDYGVDGQIGLEDTPDEYISRLVAVFHEVKRVLSDDGTLWVNIGDSYAGSGKGRKSDGTDGCPNSVKQHTNTGSLSGVLSKTQGAKPKDLIGIPWMLAFALRADGWYLRQDIIWAKPNPMPESVGDRCTRSHEYIFLLSKSAKYYYDGEAISEPCAVSTVERLKQNTDLQNGSSRVPGKTNGNMKACAPRYGDNYRNKRDVWTVTTKPYKRAHFATFPPDLIEPCILAGCPKDGMVLDPFAGSGTTLEVAVRNNRNAHGIEINPEYAKLIEERVTITDETN